MSRLCTHRRAKRVFLSRVFGVPTRQAILVFISVVADRRVGCRIPWVVDERRWTVLYGTSASKHFFILASCLTEGCPSS